MPEPFLISKAFDFTPRAIGKATSSTFKGLIIIGLIAFGCYSGYITFIKPHFSPLPTTTQQAEQITNNYITNEEESFFIGLRIFGFKVGISKNKKVKQPVITEKKTAINNISL